MKNYVEKSLHIDLSKKTRKRRYVYARAVYYQLMIDNTKLTLQEIGDTVGQDHKSVIHARDKVFPVIKLYEPELMVVYHKCKPNKAKCYGLIKDLAEDDVKEVLDHLIFLSAKSLTEIYDYECNV